VLRPIGDHLDPRAEVKTAARLKARGR